MAERQAAPLTYDSIIDSLGAAVTSYWRFQGDGRDGKSVQDAAITGQPEVGVETIVDYDRIDGGAQADGTVIAWPGTVGIYAEAEHNPAHKTAEGGSSVTFQCDRVGRKTILLCADAGNPVGGLSMEITADNAPRAYIRGPDRKATVLAGQPDTIKPGDAYTMILKWGADGLGLSLWNRIGPNRITYETNPATHGLVGNASPIRFGAWHNGSAPHCGPYGRVVWCARRLSDQDELLITWPRHIEHEAPPEPVPPEPKPPKLSFLCPERPGAVITNTFKDLGTITRTCSLTVGKDARYDFTGTVMTNSYDHASNTYSPSFNVRIIADHRGGCMFGGTIMDGYAHAGPPAKRQYPNNHGGQVFFKDVAVSDFLIDGFRFHRCWDPIRFGQGTTNSVIGVTIKQCWITHTFDDCVENDNHCAEIVVDDCLCDEIFVLVSDRLPGGSAYGHRTFTVRNTLASIAQMYDLGTANPQFQFFKLNARSLQMDVLNNTFYVPSLKAATNSAINGDPFYDLKEYGKLGRSEGNLVVWGGGGEYPHKLPAGFEVVTDEKVWTKARAEWLKDHAFVPRIPGVDKD